MPNTGRPSRDCHACRERRVKCDLLRPHCNRCLRRGSPCPGYRDELSIRFRHESISSVPALMSRDNRRRRITDTDRESLPALTEEQKTQGSNEEKGNNNSTNISTSTTCMTQDPGKSPLSFRHPVTLQNPIEQPGRRNHFVPLVLAKIAKYTIGEGVEGLFNTVPRIVTKADSRSPIYKVCNAIGLAYVTSKTQGPTANATKARGYRSALAAVNAALQDPQQQANDSTLLAVWLFGVYEFLTNIPVIYPDESYRNEIYCRGLAQLIRVRGREQFASLDGRNLVWYICCSIQFRSLMAGRESPAQVLTWICSMHQNSSPSERTMTRANIFVYHCTHLSSQIHTILEINDPSLFLSRYSAIIDSVDCLETITGPLHDDPSMMDLQIPTPLATPLTLNPEAMSVHSMALVCYMSNFRMSIALSVLEFVKQASCVSGCTLQQQARFRSVQERCIWEFQSLAYRVLSYAEYQLPPNGGYPLGWLEASMMYGSFRTIAGSHVSTAVQKEGARRNLMLFKEHLGMACPV